MSDETTASTEIDGKIITTAKGRKLTLRELGPAEMLDIFEAAGSNSVNTAWVGMAMLLCSVAAIDGVPQPMVTTKSHVKGLAKLLGNDGMIALNKEFNAPATETTTEQTDNSVKSAEAEALATAKN